MVSGVNYKKGARLRKMNSAAVRGDFLLSAKPEEDAKLQEASQLITHCVNKDERLPDWYELQSRSSVLQGGLKVSRDYLYQEEAGLRLNRMTLIPEALLGLMEEAGSDGNVFMGLLAPISRAWLSLGSKLYLWSYGEGAPGTDLTMFEKEGDSIIDVSVMRPRKGVFVEGISWLLVVTSVNQVTLLGVTLESNTLTLHKTGLAFPSDNASVLSVAGSLEGRLFAGGNDGNVYELEYSCEAKWFSKRCRKVNKTGSNLAYVLPSFLTPSFSPVIDLTICRKRSVLFSLSEDGTVSAYSLKDGGFALLGSLRIADELSRVSPMSVRLIGVEAVDESPFVSAVVFANDGSRIYLSCLHHGQYLADREQAYALAPSTLGIALVKLSPEDPGMRDPRRLVHKSGPSMQLAFERAGVFVSAWAKTVMEDALSLVQVNYPAMVTSNVTLPVEKCCYDRIRIEGKIWDIQECTVGVNESYRTALTSFPVPQRQVLVMSNAGVYIFDVLTPQDELAVALSVGNVQDDRVRGFFELYTSVQACSVCVGLGSELEGLSKGIQNGVVVWSKAAAQLYGKTPINSSLRSNNSITAISAANTTHSPLLEGLFHVAGRIVAPFWRQPLESNSVAIESSEAALHVQNLGRFIQNNIHLWAAELPLVHGLQKLLEMVLELSAFISICVDYGVLTSNANGGWTATFESALVSQNTGRTLVAELMDRLMARQLKMQSGVESLCAVLLQRCPTLFKDSQVTMYEGVEALERARRCRNRESDERQEYLRNALDHFVQAANVLTVRTFDRFVEEFKGMGAYAEIILLAVSFAQAVDPKDEAVAAYYQATTCTINYAVSEAVANRLHAYDVIIQHCLSVVLVEQPKQEAARKSVMSTIAKCRDELLHVKVLDWLLGSSVINQRREQLILGELCESPYLENYLIQRFQLDNATAAEVNDSRAVCGELLWKYYGRQERYMEAAQVLSIIATSARSLKLEERIEALSRAIAMARSSPKRGEGVEVTEMEDRLEVALIQLELYEALRKEELSAGGLLPLSDLFNKYAKPFGLTEVCLRIVQCAGHYDAVLVGDLWRQVFGADNDVVVAQKLTRLFTRFGQDEALIPLVHVIDLMVRYAQEHLMTPGWISSIYTLGQERLLEALLLVYDQRPAEYVLEEIESVVRNCTKPSGLKAFLEKRVLALSTAYPREWKTRLSQLLN